MKANEVKETIINIVNKTIEGEYYRVQDDDFSDINDADLKELKSNQSKILELENQILSMLPKEGYDLYDELETLQGNSLCIEERYMFKKGVISGLTDLGYLKEVSNCVYLRLIKL